MTHIDRIGKYHVVALIGEGGMGRVYEATDPVIGRRVAIKVISLEVESEESRARFFREAQAAGRLSHPNIITIHDIGETDRSPHIVMEFLEGTDLSRQIAGGSLSLDQKIKIMIEVCEGLAHAHDRGVVHRDIKPANIFITAHGSVKIVDFGLARGDVSDVTRTGAIVGTPSYMAPEHIRGEPVDLRADIFAAGVVFYELVSGVKPFAGDSIASTIFKVLQTEPAPLHTLGAGLPPRLSAVVERALAKDRNERYQTARELRDALLGVAGVESTIPRLGSAAAQTNDVDGAADLARRARKGVGWLGAAAALVLVAAVLGGLAMFNRRDRPPEMREAPAPVAAVAREAPAAQPEPAPAASAPAPKAAEPAAGSSRADASRPTVETATESRPQAPRPTREPSKPLEVPAAPVSASPASANPPNVTPAAPPARPAPADPRAESQRPPAEPPSSAPPASPAANERPDTSAATEAAARAAIQRMLAEYRAALESRDLSALKRIWPALNGRQEDAIRLEFDHARAIRVALDGIETNITGSSATVSGRRNYAVTTADGQKLDTASKMTMTLSDRDGSWVIDSIRFEIAR